MAEEGSMRESRTLLVAIGAAVSAGLFMEGAASALGFSLSGSSTSTSTSTSPSTSTSTTSGVSTPGTATSSPTSDQFNAALVALSAGGKTVGGPGTFRTGVDGSARIYQVLTGFSPSACVTVRNLSQGQIRVSVNEAASTDVEAGETGTSCYAMPAPAFIDLRCRQGTSCEAVWRVDRL
jgi:hypothetical protein